MQPLNLVDHDLAILTSVISMIIISCERSKGYLLDTYS